MKVIIGIDDSRHSQAALKWVERMAWPKGTRFIVLSAVPLEVTAYAGIEMAGSDALQAVYEEQMRTHEELTAQVERELRRTGLVTEGRVEQGDPQEVIVNTACVEGANLVVVGSHGRTGLPKMLMGSVASHVVTHAPCSVVVVKQAKARLAIPHGSRATRSTAERMDR